MQDCLNEPHRNLSRTVTYILFQKKRKKGKEIEAFGTDIEKEERFRTELKMI